MKWLAVFIIINIIMLHIARSSSLYCRMWMSCTRHNWSLGCSEALTSRQAVKQTAPTCCMDRHKDHRTFLDLSNSFLPPSYPYWFGPFLPRFAPFALVEHKMGFCFLHTHIYKSPHIEADEKERTYRGWGKKRQFQIRIETFQTFTATTGHSTAGLRTQYLLVTWTYEKATAFP